MFAGRNDIAVEYFNSALSYYKQYINQERRARIVQIEKMVKGLNKKLENR